MSELKREKLKQGWAFYIAILLGALVLYAASFGPVYSLVRRIHDVALGHLALNFYAPLQWVISFAPDSIREAHSAWIDWWIRLLNSR